jgi:hypothetical protein
MIIVLFPVGSFGSTIEYCLRQFSQELTKKFATVLEDGSMHSYLKEFHPTYINDFIAREKKHFEIVTPVYPGLDYMNITETFLELKKYIACDQKLIFLHLPTLAMAERNQLFCFHKIPNVLDIIMKNKQQTWNSDYKSWRDMQIFELREALSFFIDQQAQHLSIINLIEPQWLCVTPDDILYNFENTILNMLQYCNLNFDSTQTIRNFYSIWFEKQQYILNEYSVIEQIFRNLDCKNYYHWDQLSIMGEAIVQSRLRKKGIELACHRVNEFPKNLQDLKKLFLYKDTI